ncbi:MurR/RpiR family transcriptional regulator [Virgibacillus halodenitrificans]|uniref:MurR/RpiR family transcriptional regulator n=1 Tax=Virgibacillus halodenitrificans TaxID=1482 RepID=UPI0013681958|nr:MurR/RpiR family transcriptional regulator [Virgibacillus halodenitrificans]MYL57619.1 SIS domain-containing protein [Virgibacillus halodenitrificans]
MLPFQILSIVNSYQNDFTKTEKAVADFILEYPSSVVSLTTKDIANKTNTSEAAVIRFCKRIGINSFKDFKIALAKDLDFNREEFFYDSTIQLDDNTYDFVNKIFTRSSKALQSTSQLLSIQELEKAVELIHSANRVYLYGAGGSSIVAHDFTLKLLRINTMAIHHQDIHVQMMNAANMDKNDVLFVVSTSGETKEVLDLLTVAKERGTPAILLTQKKKSKARNKANVILDTSLEEQSIRIGTMAARLAQLAIIDALFTGICIKKGDKIYNYIFDTHDATSRRND